MRYAYVQDGQIVNGPTMLPSSWRNVSGFNLLPQEQLVSYGWLPWRFVEIAKPGQNWVFNESTIEITETEIVETQTYRLKTQEEIDAELDDQSQANKRFRAEAYRQESDPLFFKAQRGEATMQEWLDKVQEIRNRFPG